MRVKSQGDFAAAWQRGMQGAGANWLKGAQGTDKDPTQLATTQDALARAQANYAQASAPGGRMQQGLQRAGKQGWLAGIQAAGSAALTKGAVKGYAKLNGAVGQQLFAAQQAASAAAKAAGSSASARWMAAVNAMRAAFGKPGVS